MKRIQDVRDFENEIAAKVEEYLQETDCYQHPVLAIFREDGELQVEIDDPENFNLSEDDETYAMAEVIRASEDDPEQLEPDFDGISRIANEWVFIEH